MLQVKLFGPGQVRYIGQPELFFPHQQAWLIFCYLLLSPNHPFHRDQLAAVFWGESSAQVARKNLRNALWKLRQFLENAGIPARAYLQISDENIAFINTSPYWLDTRVFDATTAQFQDQGGEMLEASQAILLEKAVELYTGDFLEGVYDDWCLYERERLSLIYLNTLSKLMTYHEKHNQYERGLAYGERILSRDNMREKVHLQIMRLYWGLGDRQSALAQYRRCAQILQEELQIQPMDETTTAYQQMLHNQYTPTFIPVTGVMPPALPPPAILPPAILPPPPAPAAAAAQETVAASLPANAIERILEQLAYLQGLVEETRAEIRRLERLQQSPASPAADPY